MTNRGGDVRIGISGWRYGGWRGVFYPEKLPQRRELEYASRRLRSIEINGSFYSLQRPSSYERWCEETPDDFVFAVKGSRFITHMLKLREVRGALANLLASGVLRLGDKLGPMLWQFPERQRYERERFEPFLELLPRSMEAAGALAREHRLSPDRASVEPVGDGPLRHAFEVRHPSFLDPDFLDLLRSHNAAFVVADTAGIWPFAEDVTADFVYVRLHGASELYASGYSDGELDFWAERIRRWRDGGESPGAVKADPERKPRPRRRDVFVYFDNDAKVHAPFDAERLARRLGCPPAAEG